MINAEEIFDLVQKDRGEAMRELYLHSPIVHHWLNWMNVAELDFEATLICICCHMQLTIDEKDRQILQLYAATPFPYSQGIIKFTSGEEK